MKNCSFTFMDITLLIQAYSSKVVLVFLLCFYTSLDWPTSIAFFIYILKNYSFLYQI